MSLPYRTFNLCGLICINKKKYTSTYYMSPLLALGYEYANWFFTLLGYLIQWDGRAHKWVHSSVTKPVPPAIGANKHKQHNDNNNTQKNDKMKTTPREIRMEKMLTPVVTCIRFRPRHCSDPLGASSATVDDLQWLGNSTLHLLLKQEKKSSSFFVTAVDNHRRRCDSMPKCQNGGR